MKIGLIDVDSHNFPNLPLMKLSAWYKEHGDIVEWYDPITALCEGEYDKVYMSKVFTFTEEYNNQVYAKEIVKGGTGYFYPDGGESLPYEIEHYYPDYELYDIKDTAYGFLTRGCPRGCDFCIVKEKEGLKSIKVANLDEFWRGQKYIELLDPNMFACKDWKNLSQQLIDSKSWINFSQGCDIRIMSEEMVSYIIQMKIKTIHFAWDRYQDKSFIIPNLKMFKEITKWDKRKMIVYVLTNYDTTHEQDLERIHVLKNLGFWPYIMIYEKEKLPKKHIAKKLQRWVNNRILYESINSFDEYLKI